MQRQIAQWNPARDVWETQTTGLFCEHSDVFSETWPSSGMTRAGTAYEQPTSAHLTAGSASSSLLMTPKAIDGDHPGIKTIKPGQSMHLSAQLINLLLPTPKATNNENRQTPRDGATGYGLNLGMALELIGPSTPPPSPTGPQSSDAPHPHLLSQDPRADSA